MISSVCTEQMEILALPGLDGTGELSRPFITSVPDGFTARALEYPRDKRLTVNELADYVSLRLPAEKCILLAESFSGAVAIRVAATRPSALAALVLVATAAKWSRMALFRWLRLTPIFALRPPASLLRRLVLGPHASSAQVDLAQRAIASVSPSVLSARFREIARTDMRRQLRDLEMPILYLQATHDKLARRAERRSVTDTVPSTRCDTIAGPHCLLLINPNEVWGHLIDFVQHAAPPNPSLQRTPPE